MGGESPKKLLANQDSKWNICEETSILNYFTASQLHLVHTDKQGAPKTAQAARRNNSKTDGAATGDGDYSLNPQQSNENLTIETQIKNAG